MRYLRISLNFLLWKKGALNSILQPVFFCNTFRVSKMACCLEVVSGVQPVLRILAALRSSSSKMSPLNHSFLIAVRVSSEEYTADNCAATLSGVYPGSPLVITTGSSPG